MEDIQAKLASGEYELVENTSSRIKSVVWERFGFIRDGYNNTLKGFVVCKKCQKPLAFDSRKTGTSTLSRHVDICRGTIDRCFAKNSECKPPKREDREGITHECKPPTREDKEAITQLSVKFVCRDIRSFETVCGDGFTELAQGLIDIGAQSGRVDAKRLLPDATTVSRRLAKYAEDVRQSLIPELMMQLTDSSGAVTLDMWTDDIRKTGYLCVTLHYVDMEWELTKRVLCTTEWDGNLRKTGDNIRPVIIQALRKYSLDEFFSKLVYVTDRGPNIVAALRTVTRLNCAAQILNTVLHNTFGKLDENDVFVAEICDLINSAKSLVTYLKQSNLQNRLIKTLKASVETRWNSLHTMLDCINSQYEDIGALLKGRGEEHRLSCMTKETLSDIVAFLARFREASKALKASNTPTIHLAAVWLYRLRRHLQPSSTDSLTMSSLKEKCLKVLNDKFDLHLLHKLAMFLHPKLKSLKLLADQREVISIQSEARRLVKELNVKRESPLRAAPLSAGPPEKRPRPGPTGDDLADVEDSSDEALQPEDEVAQYVDFKTTKEDSFDVLWWWKKHAKIFPNLAIIARNVFAIPASSENDFSSPGFVIQERRAHLKPGTVDDVLFLHSNLHPNGNYPKCQQC